MSSPTSPRPSHRRPCHSRCDSISSARTSSKGWCSASVVGRNGPTSPSCCTSSKPTAGWLLVTAALAVFFAVSKSFGQTYGPLAGIVALLLWSLCSAVAILFGAAVAAQLEAVRAGARAPQDAEKVEHSEPASEEPRAAVPVAS